MRSSVKNKIIWTIALPIIFGNLAQTLIALTDTAFLGRVSAVALGASMMAGIYYYIYSTLAWGFAIGIQFIVARRLGEGRLPVELKPDGQIPAVVLRSRIPDLQRIPRFFGNGE